MSPAGRERPPFRSGFVAVVGRPNVGKSSLVNALVGAKVSIVADVPQTTRGRATGILTTDRHQIVFVDTPGYHKPRTLLGRRLNHMVEEAAGAEVDVLLMVVDGAAGVGRGDSFVATRHVAGRRPRKICAVNKIDRLHGDAVLPQLTAAAALTEFDDIVPVSATTGRGLPELVEAIVAGLPEGPKLFPEGDLTDQPLERRISEIVREKALELTREELPHSVATEVDEIERSDDLTRIRCVILVERESQKGMVIGRGGQMLKRIGSSARPELEVLVGSRVYLELQVRVQREWQRDPAVLARLGYS